MSRRQRLYWMAIAGVVGGVVGAGGPILVFELSKGCVFDNSFVRWWMRPIRDFACSLLEPILGFFVSPLSLLVLVVALTGVLSPVGAGPQNVDFIERPTIAFWCVVGTVLGVLLGAIVCRLKITHAMRQGGH